MNIEADEENQEEKEAEERQRILDALGMQLAETRSAAISHRESSGIEYEWLKDEEHYEGIDDANRGQAKAWRSKPLGRPYVEDEDEAIGSTIFFNMTRPYCDAAAARVGDMLLPTDDRPWSISPTPIPEMASIAKGEIPSKINRQIDDAFPGDPDGAEKTKAEVVDTEKAKLDEAKEAAKAAERQIEDWHVESNLTAEMRQIIDDSAKVGTGVIKGPIPENRRTVAFIDGQIQIQEEVIPVSRRINCWNLYPDPACGENIHRGNFIWERDDITRKELIKLLGGDYIDAQIEAVLAEGPMRAVGTFSQEKHGLEQNKDSKDLFEIWYFHGMIDSDDMAAAGCPCGEDERHNASLFMVNNRVIKAGLNVLDTGDFPYDLMIWQKRDGMCWGSGVSRQGRNPQKVINGGARNLMDNAGLAGTPMIIFNSDLVTPVDGVAEIRAGKMWHTAEGAEFDDVRKAFTIVEIPMVQAQLQAIIQLGMSMYESATGLPMLLQGQQGQASDTVGGMYLIDHNASTVLRRLARLFSDRVTEPHIQRYYTYALQYGDDKLKGDFQVDARGSSALVERAIQSQSIGQMGQMALNPVFGIDPNKWSKEFLKSQHLDPSLFEYEDEEWKKIVENMSQPAQDPRLQVEEMRQQGKQGEMQFRAQMADKEQQFDAAMAQMDQQFKGAMKQIDIENDQRKEAGKAELTVAEIQAMMQKSREALMAENKKSQDKIKGDIAQTAMRLKTQVDLNGTEALPPLVEPKPVARPGHSFSE